MSFAALWESLLPIGRDPVTGGYRRFTWTAADLECRAWFERAARERGLDVEIDGNGNLWAWWRPDPGDARLGPGAVVTGSHLDSVPDGGGYDGPLGVVGALAAVDLLRERGHRPARPIAVVVFAEEEGARFGVACLGSRLLTGQVGAERAAELRDATGVGYAQAAGPFAGPLGRDDARLARVACFVELHIEQGRLLAEHARALADRAPVPAGPGRVLGLAEGIWPHGRWRLDFTGRADHAGTTLLADRRDPVPPLAAAVLAARACAVREGGLATVGRVEVDPGAANGIAARARMWLDARAPGAAELDRIVGGVVAAARTAAAEHRVEVEAHRESFTGPVAFDAALRERIAGVLADRGVATVPVPTGAGHDAGVLAAELPTAMIFVPNPTGVSHAPGEYADPADCAAGVEALAAVLEDLACR